MIKFEFLSTNCLTFKFNSRSRVKVSQMAGKAAKFLTTNKKFYKKQFADEKQARRRSNNN